MPRAGWVKPQSDQRLSDHISIGVLTRTYPAALVDRVLAGCGRVEGRRRLLPARVMVYLTQGMRVVGKAGRQPPDAAAVVEIAMKLVT